MCTNTKLSRNVYVNMQPYWDGICVNLKIAEGERGIGTFTYCVHDACSLMLVERWVCACVRAKPSEGEIQSPHTRLLLCATCSSRSTCSCHCQVCESPLSWENTRVCWWNSSVPRHMHVHVHVHVGVCTCRWCEIEHKDSVSRKALRVVCTSKEGMASIFPDWIISVTFSR